MCIQNNPARRRAPAASRRARSPRSSVGERLDDTKAILSEILHPGPESEDGQEMISHLNRIHAAYENLRVAEKQFRHDSVAWDSPSTVNDFRNFVSNFICVSQTFLIESQFVS